MGRIVLERAFGSPLTAAELISIAQACDDCAELYRVSWLESFLSLDGKKALCIFDAPDAEAVRQLAGDASVVSLSAWPGRQHDAGSNRVPNMVVVRTLD